MREYIYLSGEPIVLKEYQNNPGIYYYLNDHLGTPQQLINGAGSTVWQAAYLPFGEAQVTTELVSNNLRFPGQYFDSETGLHYNWHRFYDPDTGRYVSADPIGLRGGINLYAYVHNNPIRYIDPKGLSVWDRIVNSNWSLSGYFGGGAEISNEWVSCCEGNKKYEYHLLIICGGVGAGAAFPEIPTPSTPLNTFGGRSNSNCPRNNDWFLAKSGSASFFAGGGYQVDVGRNEGFGGEFTTRVGGISAEIVLLKACSVTILSKHPMGECCEQ